MTRYGTLRSWAQLLKFLGVLLVIAALFGTIATAIDVDGFWKTLGVIFIGIPVAIFSPRCRSHSAS
jgi:hypothetical protein